MEIKAHPFHTSGVGRNGPALTSDLFYSIFLLNYVNLLHSQTQDLNFKKHKLSEPPEGSPGEQRRRAAQARPFWGVRDGLQRPGSQCAPKALCAGRPQLATQCW